MSHTPGPWAVFKRGPCGPSHESFWIGKEAKNPTWRGPEHIGDVADSSGEDMIFNGSRPSDKCEADANLISAAPEMFELLQILFLDHVLPITPELNKRIVNALNKAVGATNDQPR